MENFSKTVEQNESLQNSKLCESKEFCKPGTKNTQNACLRSNDKMNSILYNMFVNTYKFNVDCRLSESHVCYRVVRKARIALSSAGSV